MKISVIVTTYENPAFLRRVLDSYLRQSIFPFELVVADDGSGGDTRKVVEECAMRAPFPVIHARQEHDGPRLAKLRNLAALRASGDYLVYTDGDCVPGPRFVSDHSLLARKGFYTQGKRIYLGPAASQSFTGGESLPRLIAMRLSGRMDKAHLLIRIPGLALPVRGIRGTRSCNLAVWKDDLLRVNGWNERFVGAWREDSEFALRLQRSGVRRKDAIFSAVLFHLFHGKSDRGRREENDRLLEEAYSAPVFAADGLVKSQPPRA